MRYKPHHFGSFVLIIVSLLAVVCPSAQATYIATLNEIGTDVVGAGSGSLNTTDLTKGLFTVGQVIIRPAEGEFELGPNALRDIYFFISGPGSFGSGNLNNLANSESGNGVAVAGGQFLYVPHDYISGSPLGISTSTWNNATFASLGVTPGTYIWSWGSGINADTFTLQIGPAAPTNGVPDSGSTIALMLGAIVALAAFRSKLRAGS